MKRFIKYLIIAVAIAAIIMMFSSCQKDAPIQTEPEYKGTTYFRVEGVSKDGQTDYSKIEAINIK